MDARGQVRLSTSGRPATLRDETLREELANAWRTRQPVLTDLHFSPGDPAPHFEVIAPLFGGNETTAEPIGAVILQQAAREFLYPLIRSWPTARPSAETLLVRREGETVLFLNELRHRRDPALTLRGPLTRRDMPAVAAVLGREGVFRGKDYRGVEVLTVLKRIPDTAWVMVAKMDEAEALAEWRFRGGLIVAVIVTLVLALATAARLIGQQGARYRELAQSAAALRTANRAYRVLGACNQALVRAGDEAQLLRAVCQIAVEQGGYRLAWVGFAEEDEARSVCPVAQAGFEEGYLEGLQVTWADNERGRGPTGLAIRSGQPKVAQDILHDARFGPWRAEALQRGYAAALALPLTGQGRTFGALMIYAAEPHAFDEEELKLLEELAGDLAFGIVTLRLHAVRRLTDLALRESEARFRLMVENVKDYAIIQLDADGHVASWNAGAERFKGWRAKEIIGQHFSCFYPAEEVARGKPARELEQAAATGRFEDDSWRVRQDGSRFWANVVITALRDEAGRLRGFAKITRDITERKRAEEEIRALNASLERRVEERTAQLRESERQLHALNDRLERRVAERTAELRQQEQMNRLLLENLAEGVVACDAEGRLSLFNRVAREWHGTDPRAIPPEEWAAYYNLCEGDGCTPLATEKIPLWRAFQGERLHDVLMSIVRTDAAPRFVLASAAPLFDADGRKCGAFAIMRDITERQQTEAALRESEDRFRGLYENSLMGLYRTTPDGRILLANPALVRMLGHRSFAELAGHNLEQQSFHPSYPRQLFKEIIERDGVVHGLESAWIRADGTTVPVRESARLVRDAQGRPLYYDGVVEDISERKRAEEALRLHSAALESAANAIMITDRAGLIEAVNPAFTAMTGYTAAEALGRNPRELVKSDRHDPAFYRRLWETILAGKVWRGEIVNRRKDGSIYPEEQTITPVRDATGDITHFIAIKQDITERRQAENKVREQAGLLNQTRDAIMVIGLDNRYTYWNSGAEHITGWTSAEALGKTTEELFGGETTPAAAIRQTVMDTGAWHGEFKMRRKDDRPTILDLSISLIRDAEGRPKGRITIGTDITEQKQLAEQALRAQRVETLGMLSAGIAHDFNNALASILMAGPLLRARVSEPGGQRILDTVEKSAQRGAALVRQMMTFARGAGDRSQVLQARHILREVAELAETTFPKSIRVEPHLPADLWPVQANPTQLHQVFLNLCVNARDAMPQGGELTLTAENRRLDAAAAAELADARPGAFLTVEVRDTGTGILPEVLARIWEPFFTTKGEGQGTGLGLATVRGILHEHGGFATVQTRAGHGTAFTVYLPAAAGEAGGEAVARAVPVPRGEGELILVAEDDEVVRTLTAHLLTAHGYQVVTAGDGAEAIAVFAPRAAEVRLLLTDLQMPMLDGAALAAALRRLNPGLPIVAMSGGASQGSALHAEFTPAFLAKPFQAETLLSIVRRTLDAARPPGPGDIVNQ